MPGIIIDPGPSSGAASITTPAGGAVSVFSDRYGVSPVTLPAVISKPTTYYVAGEGPWLVNGQVVEVLEGRQVANVGPPVPSSTQQPAMVVQGAAGDGTTDDAAKVQATVTAAGVLGAVLGTQVRVTGVPGAIYFCSFGTSTPTGWFAGITLPSNVVLDGITFKFPEYSGSPQVGIYGAGITNSDIRNCTLTGGGIAGESEVNHNATLFYYSGSTPCSNITIANNTFSGWRSNGVFTFGDNASVFSTNIMVSGNTFTNVNHMVNLANGAVGCSIIDNYGNTALLNSSGAEAIIAGVSSTATYANILIRGNIIINWSFGIDMLVCGTDITIDNNLIDSSANSAISTVGINCPNSITRLRITNNIIVPGSVTSPAATQIWIGHGMTNTMPVPSDLTITGNMTINRIAASAFCIGVSAGTSGFTYTNVNISDNTCYTAGAAMQVQNAAGVVIKGNYLSSTAGSPTALLSFSPTPSCTGVVIADNVFVNGWAGSSVVPSGTVITGNTFSTTVNTTYLVGISSSCVVANNLFNAPSGTFAGAEAVGTTGSEYVNNILIGGCNNFSTNATPSTRMAGNIGFNPKGHGMTQPAVPATTVALTNTFLVDATVFIATGAGVTVSAIAIGGTATGVTMAASAQAGGFRVPVGQTITLTYAGGTPTWQWFGD